MSPGKTAIPRVLVCGHQTMQIRTSHLTLEENEGGREGGKADGEEEKSKRKKEEEKAKKKRKDTDTKLLSDLGPLT
ncbi:Disintegrin And Metalloproteinase Domain-Containing Protein 30 [Manis pentadactyla]|nr:Disintegrin And Metalloproteinase Domain-Containing Protein 30 [Manis pentadactyla]